jgi:murein DD-endopeptidase MepM/ murein hydrolase activator NlpD
MMRWLKIAGIGVLGLTLLASVIMLSTPVGRALFVYAPAPEAVAVPVMGVEPAALESSWGAPRPENRKHEGIDIFARRGTRVVSATAGQVIKVGHNRLGGKVVWIAGEGMSLYYYAHLDHFEPGLVVGDRVARGTVLGYVGNTGNAKTTPPHLHFGIYPAGHWFRAVDPTPLLRRQGVRSG